MESPQVNLRQAKKVCRRINEGHDYPERTRWRAVQRIYRGLRVDPIDWRPAMLHAQHQRFAEFTAWCDAEIARRVLCVRGEPDFDVVPSEGARYPHTV